MLRDPNGPESLTIPNTKWNPKDNVNWTPEFRKQVPFGIDPLDYQYHRRTGVLFIDDSDLKKCFSDLA